MSVLSPITNENKQLIKKWLPFSEVRHYEAENNVKIVITDNNEVLIFQTNMTTALYSNDPQFVSMLKSFVKSIWEHSPPAADKIEELETGKPLEQMLHVRGREDIYKELEPIYDNTKKDIILMTTSSGLIRFYKYLLKMVKAAVKRGVKIRILTHVNKKNVAYVKKVSDLGVEVKHVEKVYAVASCYDDSFMQMMRVRNDSTGIKSDDISIITNQKYTVKMIRQMLEEMWVHGTEASQIEDSIKRGKPIQEMRIVSGKENIYKLLSSITKQAKKEICMLASRKSLDRAVKYGYFDIDRRLAKKVKVRYLIPITEFNKDLVKKAMEFADVRHIEFTPIRVRLVDGKRCTIRYGGGGMDSLEEGICIFSNINKYVSNIKEHFENTWNSATPAGDRISELETGKIAEKTTVYRDSSVVSAKSIEMLKRTKKEALFVLSPRGVRRLTEVHNTTFNAIKEKAKKIRVRFVTQVTENNINSVKKLLPIGDVRHVDSVQTVMTYYDDFGALLGRKIITDPKVIEKNPDDSIYIITTHKGMVSSIKNIAEDIWNKAIHAKEKITEIETGKPLKTMKIVSGKENIWETFKEITASAKKEVYVLSTEQVAKRAEDSGLSEMQSKLAKKGVKVRYIMPITKENLDHVKRLMKYAEIRHIDSTPIAIRLIDGEVCTMRHGGEDFSNTREICIYSNIPSYVVTTKQYYENTWRTSIPAEERIKELETGIPREEVKYIRGRENLYALAAKHILSSKKDMFFMATEIGIVRMYKNIKKYIDIAAKKGVRIRCITIITDKNKDIIRDFDSMEIRHVEKMYSITDCYDDSVATIMHTNNDTESTESPNDVIIYSTQRDTIKMMRNMMEEVWRSSVPSEEKIKQLEDVTVKVVRIKTKVPKVEDISKVFSVDIDELVKEKQKESKK